ncbi:DNA replication complex subunit [Pseudozyma hubeiensis SY62]|uniref:DNA replication complex subunit n=1 Tax=Pseudozyma hubeiensis (strain SY62) TaxID=1305764 RepID=R9P1V4_PSEHS|nr:DNA replication complex subunit [Pseudozyma hubeiensis SY62]GAC95293.1 DNA replication complex subunit [Pseudozyma hubeiensis SY62]
MDVQTFSAPPPPSLLASCGPYTAKVAAARRRASEASENLDSASRDPDCANPTLAKVRDIPHRIGGCRLYSIERPEAENTLSVAGWPRASEANGARLIRKKGSNCAVPHALDEKLRVRPVLVHGFAPVVATEG